MKFKEILDMANDAAFIHPAGKKVPAVVHTAVYKKSNQGNHMVALTFRVTGGPNAGKGRPIRHFIMPDQDSARQQVLNMGIKGKEYDALAEYEAEDALARLAAMVLGKPCTIDIVQDTWNDKLQNKVTWVNPATSGAKPGPVRAAVAEEPEPDDEPEDELAALRRQLAEAKQDIKRSDPPEELPF